VRIANRRRLLFPKAKISMTQDKYMSRGRVHTEVAALLDSNPVGFREHINPAYQGLRHIPGRGPYPIQESFFARGFGTGTRHRGAAVVVEITTDLTYTPPTIET
jgi:hypothetical protein